MIKRYSDHAANERTFLAWVRTAIAVMAFGFLIERFDLFLRYIAPQAAQRQAAPRNEAFANWAGLAFIVLGIAMIIIAGVRLAKTAKAITVNAINALRGRPERNENDASRTAKFVAARPAGRRKGIGWDFAE
jgi:putative membrane protein